MQRFTNKTVLITGGGSGMGAATARRFSSEGANVVLVDREKPDDIACELPAERTLALAADVADSAAIGSAIIQAVEKFGQLDVAGQ